MYLKITPRNFWPNLSLKKSIVKISNKQHRNLPKLQKMQYENFQKMKATPQGIHPSHKCDKFQTHQTIYAFPRVPQRFSVHLGFRMTRSPRPKNQNFQKRKKRHPKGFAQAISVPNFRKFWPFRASLECTERFWFIQGLKLGSQGPEIKIFKK